MAGSTARKGFGLTPDSVSRYRLCSGELPEPQRLGACREFFGDPMVGLDFAPLDHEAFGVDVSFAILPDIRIGAGRFREFRIDRTRAQIAADGNADFALIIALSGDHHACQLGRDARLGPGQAILTTDAEPGSVRYGEGSDFIVLQPSRQALSALVPDCDDAVARTIDDDGGALRLLTGYAAMVQQDGMLESPTLRHLAATHLLDLVALAVGTARAGPAEARNGGVRAARLAAVKADIDRRLLRPDLSIGAVAARQGITPRYIARLFAGEQTTFTDYVRDRRLERARRRLIAPGAADRPICAIAFECGFGDLSYFNRCFRRRFGASPSEVRKMAESSADRASGR